jgi:hypothetical protein
LIHGQEVDTLAGHADLTWYFDLNPAGAPSATGDSTGRSMAPAAAPVH